MKPLLFLLLVALAGCVSTDVRDDEDREPITSEPALMSWLGDRNYIVEQTGFTSRRTQGALGNTFVVSGYASGTLRTWTFGTASAAERALREVRRDRGPAARSSQVSYYTSGPLLVEYVGSDAGLRADLAEVLGRAR